MNKKNIKISWPNKIITQSYEGEKLLSIAKTAEFDIPTGCMSGRCGACEILLNGKITRSCIKFLDVHDKNLIVENLSDPYW